MKGKTLILGLYIIGIISGLINIIFGIIKQDLSEIYIGLVLVIFISYAFLTSNKYS